MSHLVKMVRLFSKDENGAALVEYAVIFAVLIAGTVGAFTLISDSLVTVFGQVNTTIANLFP